ncbi:MAG TPA: hypothetical protein VMJ32_04005 [Pirellulales bacterium]|nr:hypothetical protein [Pirellulales bacterium]
MAAEDESWSGIRIQHSDGRFNQQSDKFAARFLLASDVIGWVEIDELVSEIGAALTPAQRPFCPRTGNRAHRMTTDPVTPINLADSKLSGTEFVEVDADQLLTDLEAEFVRILRRFRAK